MGSQDPQFVYMVLVLPGLFGLTLVGEGMVKLIQEKVSGWFNLLMGLVFLVAVVGGYFILNGMI